MAQGYPPPQPQQYGYGPNPYAQQPQPPQPYPPQGYPPPQQPYPPQGQQPYPPQPQPYAQQPYPAQGQPQPQPYAQPQQPYPPQEQQPYPPQGYQQQPAQFQQPYAQQPYAQPQPELPKCPEEAFAGRRFLAIVLDFLLALVAGFAAAIADDKTAETAKPVVHAGHTVIQSPVVPFWVAFIGVSLLTSFLNQVVLARLTGFSVGKGILAMRVVRRKHVQRPNTWRLTRRWLLGFVVLIVMWLSDEVEVSEGDIVGMRSVRWKHLREYEQAVGRLG
ncbi:RDD family protein [Kitasatospora sp. NPDC094028]